MEQCVRESNSIVENSPTREVDLDQTQDIDKDQNNKPPHYKVQECGGYAVYISSFTPAEKVTFQIVEGEHESVHTTSLRSNDKKIIFTNIGVDDDSNKNLSRYFSPTPMVIYQEEINKLVSEHKDTLLDELKKNFDKVHYEQ